MAFFDWPLVSVVENPWKLTAPIETSTGFYSDYVISGVLGLGDFAGERDGKVEDQTLIMDGGATISCIH